MISKMKLTAFEKHAASLSEAFWQHSEELWRADKTPCTTSLSALSFLLAGSLHRGAFVQAAGFLHETINMGHALGIWGYKGGVSHDLSTLEKRALAFAAWSAYCHNV